MRGAMSRKDVDLAEMELMRLDQGYESTCAHIRNPTGMIKSCET